MSELIFGVSFLLFSTDSSLALLAFVHGGLPAGVVNYLTRRNNETLRRNELPPKCAATTALLILLRVTGNGGPGLRRRRHARLRPRRRPPRRPGAVVLSVALPLPPPLSSVIAIRPHYFCRPRLFCSPSPFAAVGCSSLLPLTPPFAPPPFTTAAFSAPPSPFVVVARPSFVCRHRISCLPSPFAGAVRLSSLFRRRPPARLPPLTAPLSVAPSAPLSRAKCASASVRKTRPWELGSAPPVVTCGVISAVVVVVVAVADSAVFWHFRWPGGLWRSLLGLSEHAQPRRCY